MGTHNHALDIVKVLGSQDPHWEKIDWVYLRYKEIHEQDRADFVAAMGGVIESAAPTEIVANLVGIVFDLGLFELHETVQSLHQSSRYDQEAPIRLAVDRYMEGKARRDSIVRDLYAQSQRVQDGRVPGLGALNAPAPG